MGIPENRVHTKISRKNSPVSCMQPAGGHHCAK
eukprot:SAG11_NODE_27447_length_332_cov_1.446352_1_plen_32_part_01